MSVRYAIAVHRIKDAERSQDSTEQISWATNEMASILKEGDPAIIDLPIAWAGLAMAQRAQHEIASAFETGEKDLEDAEDRALYTLKQVHILSIFKNCFDLEKEKNHFMNTMITFIALIIFIVSSRSCT